MSEAKQQSLPPGYQLEEYTIIRELGSGGFGITYLALDLNLEREVVIKENLPIFAFRDPSTSTVHPKSAVGEDKDLFEWSLESFVREARTLAKFDHPNIVKIHRIFEANGTAYFVMPYVEGRAFSEWIGERKAAGGIFAEEELRALLLTLLEALEALHGQQVYHRDIKPGNVLVTSRGTPVLIDFGAARQMVSERSHTVVESPGYTPFEQLESRGNVGPWSDLYGLAATFYKALTFENPPKATDRVNKDAITKLAEDDGLRARLGHELLSSLDAALAFTVENRPQTAGEMAGLMEASRAVEEERAEVSVGESERLESGAVEPGDEALRKNAGKDRAGGRKKGALMAIGLGGLILAGIVTMMAIWPNLGRQGPSPSEDPSLVPTPLPAADSNSTLPEAPSAEIVALREQLAAEKKELAAEKKAREEAERKAVTATTPAPVPAVPSVPVDPIPMTRPTPAVRPSLSRSRSMEGSRAGEVREFGGIEMVWCPPGEFLMGSPANEEGRSDNETQHRVTLTKGFWMAKTETTQGLWESVMGNNPSSYKGVELPVETVSWDDIKGYLTRMNTLNSLPSGWEWVLPSEAQWEYACRAGTETAFAGTLYEMDWYSVNSEMKTHPVRTRKANAWGIHDMHGNVSEWCAHWSAEYENGSVVDPGGVDDDSITACRGGSWGNQAWECRSAKRAYLSTDIRIRGIGFRVALVPAGR